MFGRESKNLDLIASAFQTNAIYMNDPIVDCDFSPCAAEGIATLEDRQTSKLNLRSCLQFPPLIPPSFSLEPFNIITHEELTMIMES